LEGKLKSAISPKREKELRSLGYAEKTKLICKIKKQIAVCRNTPRRLWSKELAPQYALLRKELNFLRSCWSFRKLPALG
jgi:hypothetical protein